MKICNKYISLIILFIFCLLISIYPLLQIRHTGFYFDDTLNSQIDGYLKYNNESILDFTNTVTVSWFKEGRILNFFYLYPIWAGPFKSLNTYKTILIITNLISIILFGFILKKIIKSNNIFWLSLILLPIFFQFKNYPDSITSFHLLLQLIWIKFSLSIIFFIKYLKENKKKYLLISLTLYTLMLLMFYEVAYFLFPIIIFLSFIQKKEVKYTLKKCTPFILLSLLFILISFYVQNISEANTHYSGTTINLNFNLVFLTFIKQLYSSIPGIYYFHHQTPFKFINKFDYFYIFSIFTTTFILLVKTKIKKTRNLFILGFLLLTLPAIPIALSQKYQQSLEFGIGYLPVFIQLFGTFCIIISLFFLVLKIKIKSIKIFIIILISSITSYFAFINVENNRVVTEELNTFYKYPRYLLEQGLKSDLLKDIKDHSMLISLTENPWDSSSFYLMNTNKKIDVKYIPDLIQQEKSYKETDSLKLIENFNNSSYIIGYQLSNKNIGSVFIGNPTKLIFNNQKNEFDLLINNTKIFIIGNKDYKFISYKAYKNNQVSEIIKEIPINDIDNKIILEINETIDPKTIFLKTNYIQNQNINTKNNESIFFEGVEFKWENGFSGLEQLNNNNWHWCSNSGKLKIINFNQNSKKIKISTSINSGYESESNLQININNQEKINFKINNHPLEFSKTLYIKPGITTIEFNSDAPKINTGNDPRDLRFKLNNFSTTF